MNSLITSIEEKCLGLKAVPVKDAMGPTTHGFKIFDEDVDFWLGNDERGQFLGNDFNDDRLRGDAEILEEVHQIFTTMNVLVEEQG